MEGSQYLMDETVHCMNHNTTHFKFFTVTTNILAANWLLFTDRQMTSSSNPLKRLKLHAGLTTQENRKPMRLQTRGWVTLWVMLWVTSWVLWRVF